MELNYNELGFKCGLEIHQQLEGKKLFCSCTTINSDKEPDVKFERRLRAVAGETGEIDIAAAHEMQKRRKFIYEADSQDTCLVEYDEEPPHELNRKALESTLKIALLLNAKIVDEIRVMRKNVVDGSNVSGFQRTALVAMDGFIETSLGKVNIPIICLEEEAAQKLESEKDARTESGTSSGGFVRYRLDRLGIPLIEIATGTEIKNPEHAKETASIIGMILRSVDGVRRGLGTIRQDVNVSIKNGARTEIKGFQDLRSIPKVINYEIERQLNEIKKGKILEKQSFSGHRKSKAFSSELEKEVRKAEPDFTTSFLRPLPGAARLYPETDVAPVKIEKGYVNDLRKNLPKLLKHKAEELEKRHRISNELAKELIEKENFEDLAKKFNKLESSLVAHILINVPKEIKTRFKLDTSKLKDEHFEEILDYLNKGKIAKEAVIDLLVKKINDEKIDFAKFASVSEKDIEKEIKELIEKKKDLSLGAYMGILMSKYRGKIDGSRIMELLKKYVK
ncbi:Glu-tRNA(Gln) amidotransferase subunit GatE [Candidatus Woesearchaeota archaeon]|nr:Glu-tRNA(Gln) amidotransferase subunit GatE [Candidatus Woesearchaeota archaeon]